MYSSSSEDDNEEVQGGTRKQNTHKFLSFTQRIANIDVDIFHKIGPVEMAPVDSDSYFNQVLYQWSITISTGHFETFHRQVRPFVNTLPQILFNKDSIINILLEHLSVPHTSAIEPLLQLTAALAKDLRDEFYPSFRKFLKVFLRILNPKDSVVIDKIFTTLSYLFKFLAKHIVKDLEKTFRRYRDFLAKKRIFLRDFAAESFSYLLRKSDEKLFPSFLELVFEMTPQNNDEKKESYFQGITKLFFFTFKGVKGQFFSKAAHTIPHLFKALRNLSIKKETPESKDANNRFDLIHSTVQALRDHCVAPHSDILVNTICQEILPAYELCKEDTSQRHLMIQLLRLLKLFTDYKKGNLITDKRNAIQSLKPIIENKELLAFESVNRIVFNLFSFFLDTCPNLILVELPNIRPLLISFNDTNFVLDFCRSAFKTSSFAQIFLPSVIGYLDNIIESKRIEVIGFVLEIVQAKPWKKGTLCSVIKDDKLILTDKMLSIFMEILEYFGAPGYSRDLQATTLLWNTLTCLNQIYLEDVPSFVSVVQSTIERLTSILKTDDEVHSKLAAELLFLIVQAKDLLLNLPSEDLELEPFLFHTLELLTLYPKNIFLLRNANNIFGKIGSQPLSKYDTNSLEEELMFNLTSPVKPIRHPTLILFKHFAKFYDVGKFDAKLLDETIDIEKVRIDAVRGKEVIVNIRNIESWLKTKPIMKRYHHLLIHYLIGTFYIKFTPIWPVSREVLGYLAEKNFDVFWKVFFPKLSSSDASSAQPNLAKEWGPVMFMDKKANKSELTFTDIVNSKDETLEYTNHASFNTSLWRTLEDVASLMENSSTVVVEQLLRLLLREFRHVLERDQDLLKSVLEEAPELRNEPVHLEKEESRSLQKLSNYLNLFSKFKNPKDLHKAPLLKKIYIGLLRMTDENTQKNALNCLLTWNDEEIVTYKESLEKLVDTNAYTHFLPLFNVYWETTDIKQSHRKVLIPLVINILYGKFMTDSTALKVHTAKRAKSTKRKHQKMILTFLAGLNKKEMLMFFDLYFSPLKKFLETKKSIHTIGVAELLTLFETVQMIFKNLSSFSYNILPTILDTIITVLSQLLKRVWKPSHKKQDLYTMNEIFLRRAAIQSLTTILELFPDFELDKWLTEFLSLNVTKKNLLAMDSSKQNLPPMVKCLLTFGKSDSLIPHLPKNDRVINALIGCMRNAEHYPFVDEFVEFFENVIKLEISTEKEDKTQLKYLSLVDVNDLLRGIQQILVEPQFSRNSALKQRILNIASNLTQFVKNETLATALFQLFLTLLWSRDLHESRSSIVNALGHLTRLVPVSEDHIIDLSHSFMYFEDQTEREDLCKLFTTFSQHYPKLVPPTLAEILTQLNSYSVRELDTVLFETRIKAFTKVNEKFHEIFSSLQLVPILANYMFLLKSNELSTRSNSSFGIEKLLARFTVNVSKGFTFDVIQRLVVPQIVKTIASKRSEPEEVTEYLALLSKIGRLDPRYSELLPLINDDIEKDFFRTVYYVKFDTRIWALDFFCEVSQTQKFKQNTLSKIFMPLFIHLIGAASKHEALNQAVERAIKACAAQMKWYCYSYSLDNLLYKLKTNEMSQHPIIRSMCAVLDSFHFSVDTPVQPETPVLPLNLSAEDEVKKVPAKKKAQKAKTAVPKEEQKKKKRKGKKVEEEMEVVEEEEEEEEGEAPEQLTSKDDDVDKINVDDVKEEEEEEDIDFDKLEEEVSEDKMETEQVPKETEEKPKKTRARKIRQFSAPKPENITKEILEKILPQLNGYINRNKLHPFRAHVALVQVRILKLLPVSHLQTELPRLIYIICGGLASKEIKERNANRDILIQIANLLGEHYFMFIIQQLRSFLVKGFQLHVLGFTVFRLLKETKFPVGSIDYCFKFISEIILDEVMGMLAEKKEVDQVSNRMKETKKTNTYECYEFLAQQVKFNPNINLLLGPLINMLNDNRSFQNTKKVRLIFKYIIKGLLNNSSVTVEDMLLFVHHVVTTALNENLEKSAQGKEEKKDAIPQRSTEEEYYRILPEPRKNKEVLAAVHRLKDSDMMINFGLVLLESFFKKGRVSQTDEFHCQMLDPFVSILLNCLLLPNTDIITLVLDSLVFLIEYFSEGLPSLKKHVDTMKAQLFDILQNTGSYEQDLNQAVIKCLTNIINKCSFFKIDDWQVNALIQIVSSNLEDSPNSLPNLKMVHALIARKYLAPEIYDICKRLFEVLLNSNTTSVRHSCSHILITFLIEYPLGKKRIKQHFDFIVNNLNFPYEMGRKAMLEMINLILTNFPKEMLEEHSKFFYLPLILRLVNDDSKDVRQMSSLLIRKIIESSNRFDELFEALMTWLKPNTDPSLSRAALQVLSIYLESRPKPFLNELNRVVYGINQMVGDDVSTEQSEKEWEVIYFAFILCEKLFTRNPQLVLNKSVRGVWQNVLRNLSHTHLWVQFVCTRLVGIYLASFKKHNINEEDPFFGSLNQQVKMFRILMNMLDSPLLDEPLAQQIVKNLIYLAVAIARLSPIWNRDASTLLGNENPSKKRKIGTSDAEGEQGQNEEVEEEEKGEVDIVESEEEQDEDEEEGQEKGEDEKDAGKKAKKKKDEPMNFLKGLFKQLSTKALLPGKIRKSSILSFFGACISQFSLSAAIYFFQFGMRMVYHFSTSNRPSDEQVRDLALKVSQVIEKKVGTSRYFKTYETTRKKIETRRKERKQAQKLLYVTDIAKATGRKIHKNKKTGISKKRRNEADMVKQGSFDPSKRQRVAH